MNAANRVRHALRGAGSVLDLWPAARVYRGTIPTPHLTAEERAIAERSLDRQAALGHDSGGGTDLCLGLVLAWVEYLAANPDARRDYPGVLEVLEEWLDRFEQQPVRVGNMPRVGNLWVDRVKLAADRFRVHKRLVQGARELTQKAFVGRRSPDDVARVAGD